MDIERKIQTAFEYYRDGNYSLAEKCLKEALQIRPESAELHNNLGLILQGKGNLEEAIIHFERALAIDPELADCHYNLGNILREKRQDKRAVDYYKKALRIDPVNSDVYINLGIIFKENGRLAEAIAFYEEALRHNSNNPLAYLSLGNVLVCQGRLKEAETSYRTALLLDPNLVNAYSNLLCSMNYNAEYDARSIFSEHLQFQKKFAGPFPSNISPHMNEKSPGRRLKIGYVSSDFRQHSVAYFIEPVISAHDRDNFEIFGYSDVLMPDEVTMRIRESSDQWREIARMSDEQAAALIRDDRIDILIDLAGHTADNRMLLFARKPAPLQVSWIGYPATTGLSTVDYKISDYFTDPSGMTEQFYTEKMLRLPESFLCYRPDRNSPLVGDLPALTARNITFGSFNNFAKVSPEIVQLWTRILRAVPGSRLILKSHSFSDQETCKRLMDVFCQAEVAKHRIELLPQETTVREHLNLYNRLDIGLDTFPYHGTTTTCEAMWMGVPVITLAGSTYAARVGPSLLSNVGIEKLIADTPDEYVRIAVELAGDIEKLQKLRKNLRDMMKNSPLTDAGRFTANLEMCYRKIWENCCERC